MRSLLQLFALVIALVGWAGFATAQNAAQILVGAGEIASCDTDKAQATAKLLDKIPGTVFTAGDNAYAKGAAREFIECYGLSWGRHRARTRPAPGNHDYESKQAAPYFKYFGANAGPAGRGYYSYDLGSWHVVSLNSNPNAASRGKEQEQWLRQDLEANRFACTLAYWHHPYVSSGKNHSNNPHLNNLFRFFLIMAPLSRLAATITFTSASGRRMLTARPTRAAFVSSSPAPAARRFTRSARSSPTAKCVMLLATACSSSRFTRRVTIGNLFPLPVRPFATSAAPSAMMAQWRNPSSFAPDSTRPPTPDATWK